MAKPLELLGGKFSEVLSRVQALEASKSDPHVSEALTKLLLAPPYTAQSSRALWSSVFDQLGGAQAHPGVLLALRPLVGTYEQTFGKTKMGASMEARLAKLVKALEKRFPDAKAGDGFAAPKAAPAKRGGTLEDLLAAVYANPADDAPRLVYADALLEAGDPRGEFIMLQLKRHRGEALSPAEEKREAALFKKHRKEWTGPAGELLTAATVVFRRGFLAEGAARQNSKALLAARNHPSWSTLEELETFWLDPSVLNTPALRNLRTMRGVNHASLEVLCAGDLADRALDTLEISWLELDERGAGKGVAAWSAFMQHGARAFPRLKRLLFGSSVTGHAAPHLNALWENPLVKQLELLRLSDRGWSDAALVSFLVRATPRLRVECVSELVTVAALGDGRGEVHVTPRKTPVTDEYRAKRSEHAWPRFVAALQPAAWREFTSFPGALTDAQVELLQKQLPRAKVTAAPSA